MRRAWTRLCAWWWTRLLRYTQAGRLLQELECREKELHKRLQDFEEIVTWAELRPLLYDRIQAIEGDVRRCEEAVRSLAQRVEEIESRTGNAARY